MKLRKLVTTTAIGFAILGLAACASNTSSSDDTGADGAALGPEFGFQSPAGLSDADLLKRTSYYFNFNSSTLVQTNLAAVEAQGRYLSKHPDQVVLLEGNADKRGSREYNIGLGWRRDVSVEKVLEANGVAKSQIHMVSYGAEKPVALGDSAVDYAKNRRVDIVYCQTSDCKSVYNNDAPKSDI